MFASKTPRDLFPEPPQTDDYWWDQRLSAAIHHERQNFAQHNEPNPILIAFRNLWDQEAASFLVEAEINQIDKGKWDGVARYSHIDHAREVLTRLANLSSAT